MTHFSENTHQLRPSVLIIRSKIFAEHVDAKPDCAKRTNTNSPQLRDSVLPDSQKPVRILLDTLFARVKSQPSYDDWEIFIALPNLVNCERSILNHQPTSESLLNSTAFSISSFHKYRIRQVTHRSGLARQYSSEAKN